MNCIVRLYGLGGGAPRSLLQHLLIYSANGYNKITCMACKTDEYMYSEYQNNQLTIINRKSPSQLWNEHRYFAFLREYSWEIQHIKKIRPDLVIALDEINGALYSYICKQLGIPLIIYIPGGDLTLNKHLIELWNNCEVVCFSKENEDIIDRFFDQKHTHTISNRIEIKEVFLDLSAHYQVRNQIIHILLVSRITDEKIQSIYQFIHLLSKCASKDNPIQLRIAGKGEKEQELQLFCNTIDNEYLSIQTLGQVNDLTEEFRWAHIVAGKGRSVIEPIMMNRIGCVIADNGDIQFCNQESFDNLYHYNFSGRQMVSMDSQSLMSKKIQKLTKGIIDTDCIISNL